MKKFQNFSILGTEEQLKKFCRLLPSDSDIDFLGISLQTNETQQEVLLTEWPNYKNVRFLKIDVTNSDWYVCCSELLQTAPQLRTLLLIGNNGAIDFQQSVIPSPQKLQFLYIFNVDLVPTRSSQQLLFNTLASYSNLKRLTLSNCQLPSATLLPLLQSLKNASKTLEWLYLCWNKAIGKDPQGFRGCCQELAQFPALKKLWLPGTGLDDSSIDALKHLIQESQTLTEVDLGYNRFQSDEKLNDLKKFTTQNNLKLWGV